MPLRFSAEKVEALIGYASRGYHPDLCAALCKLSPKTLSRWLDAGRKEIETWEDDEVPFDPLNPRRLELSLVGKFFLEFEAAQAEIETTITDMLRDTGRPEDLRWLLERRHPRRWGAKQAVELSGPDQGPIQVSDARESLLRGLFPAKGDADAKAEAE
jgi:hypothetical protein